MPGETGGYFCVVFVAVAVVVVMLGSLTGDGEDDGLFRFAGNIVLSFFALNKVWF